MLVGPPWDLHQRTKTWKVSPDPDFDAKLARIEYAINQRPDRTFAFDEFGPLGIRPTAGSCWALENRPDRLPATYRRTHGITYFHGCYSVGDDQLWGINRKRKGIDHTWAALRTIRAARPDGAPIYVILDNLSAHLNWRIRRWAARNNVELCGVGGGEEHRVSVVVEGGFDGAADEAEAQQPKAGRVPGRGDRRAVSGEQLCHAARGFLGGVGP